MFRSSTMGRWTGRWLLVFGIFELVLAAGFLLFAANVPEGREGMLFTGGLLGLTGLVLLVVGVVALRRAGRADQISATGLSGTGQIMALTQTGTFLNDNPQVAIDMQVQVMGRSPYRVTVKEFVPLIMLNRLQGTLPVRVDPAHPEHVVIQWDQPPALGGANTAEALAAAAAWWSPVPGGIPGAGPAGIVPGGPGVIVSGGQAWTPLAGGAVPGGSPGVAETGGQAWAPAPAWSGPGSGTDETLGQVAGALAAAGVDATLQAPPFGYAAQAGYSIEQLRAFLRASGLAGTARIDRLDDSGQTVGDERLFTMTTTVSIPGRPTFTTGPSAAMVPLEKVGRIAVGVALPVRVAPDNPDLLMFEWDRI